MFRDHQVELNENSLNSF